MKFKALKLKIKKRGLKTAFFFWKLDIRPKDRLIQEDQSQRSFAGGLFKARFFFTLYGLSHQN
jgi:hypothetical protein